MRRAVVGVIGHVDHGKTALVRALTGTETDRLAEEKARGVSIALGFAHLETGEGRRIDLIDMPGHERFVRTMISGATGIDAALLVVAASEGVMPQTVEHCDIAALLGIRQALVAVTKTDLVAPGVTQEAAGEAARLLRDRGIDPAEAIPVSAVTGQGIDDLRAALARLADRQAPRSGDGLAWLPIDRAFSMRGHGPVVTGTLRGSSVRAGDTLDLHPGGKELRVRAVQVHGGAVDAAQPGERVALNLRDVAAGTLARGMALGAPGAFAPSEWLTLAIVSVADAPPLANGARLRALVGTAEVDARLRLLDRDLLAPGDSGFAQVRLAEPLAVPAREHLILRIASPARTVAGGMILEPRVRRRKRRDAAALAWLGRLRDLAPDAIVAAEIEHGAARGTSIDDLSCLTALAPERIEEIVGDLPAIVTRKRLVFRQADLAAVMHTVPGLLTLQPGGLSRNQILSSLHATRAALLDEALDRLTREGALSRRGSQYLLPSPGEDRRREADEAELAGHLAETLRRSGLTPPNPGALLTDAATRRAAERLLRQGVLIRAVDRAKSKELIFHRDAIAEARRRLEPRLRECDGLLVTEIAAMLGISRKFTMPLLDHLDTIRFTRREGDRRMLHAAAADRR